MHPIEKLFQSRKHSLGQVKQLYELANKQALSGEAFRMLLEESVRHGLPFAESLLERADGQAVVAEEALRYYEKQLGHIRQQADPRPHFKRNDLVNAAYATKGCVYLDQPGSGKLLVIFLSMFNNFYLSNLILMLLLSHIGASILILKDDTPFYFLKGVENAGEGFDGVVDLIRKTQAEHRLNELYISGFSSGGYAALLMSSMLPCKAFLGFSIRTSLVGTGHVSVFPGLGLHEYISEHVQPHLLLDLRQVLEQRRDGVPRKLFYGLKSDHDVFFAEKLTGLDATALVGLDVGHLTVGKLMEEGSLRDEFTALVNR